MGPTNDGKIEGKIIYLFIVLFFISFIKSFQLLLLAGALVIIYAIIFAGQQSIAGIIKSILPLIVLLFLPLGIRYLWLGEIVDLDFTLLIVGKIIVSALILGTFVAQYSVLYLMGGILKIGLPPLLNRILALTFRYFYMINDDVQIGRKALLSRGLAERKVLGSWKIIGEWIGGFFLKSSTHSEMVFQAMKARGFDGYVPENSLRKSRLLIQAGILSFFLIMVLVLEGML